MKLQVGSTMISVACAWGEASDVLMDLTFGQDFHPIDLTAAQAEQIGYALLNSAAQAKNLEELAKEHDSYTTNQMDV